MTDETHIAQLGEFLARFRDKNLSAKQHYEKWSAALPDHSLEAYIKQSFADAFLYISKHADDEKQFREWKLVLDTKRWEYEREWKTGDANIWLKQIHIDKLLIENQSAGFECELIIQSRDCCSACAKRHGKRVTLVSVLKGKHLPYSGCKRKDYCICTYEIVS